ncbi:MAG: hypothetical protein ACOZQL_26560 [Myxococcota bacterium]
MNRTLLAVAVAALTLGAQVARADDFDGDGFDDGYQHGAVPARSGRHCGPRPTFAPQGSDFQQGRYELQTTQVWVPGAQQQVWVEGNCYGRRRHHWRRQCTPGHYEFVSTPGHYETTQQWVWVPYPTAQPQYGGQYRGAGFSMQHGGGTFSVSVY